MTNIAWKINRLRAMDLPAELWYRVGQQVQHRLLDRIAPIHKQVEIKPLERFTENYSVNGIQDYLDEATDWKHFDYFDHSISDVTKLDSWREDLKHGISSRIQLHSSLDPQNFKQVGDIKYTHELSRFHHLPVMAMASVQDPQYAALCEAQILSWIKQNPYLHSINWSSGIEVGIRLINWVYALKLIKLNNQLGHEDAISQSIYQHGEYLIRHLSRYSSANNHLLAELAGLIVIAANFDFEEQEAWLQEAGQMLLHELKAQVHPDGFGTEQSTHYHAFSFDLFLISLYSMQTAGMDIPEEAWERMQRMGHFMSHLMQGNTLQEIGDSDDGHVFFPYYDPDYSIYGSMMSSAALLTDESAYLRYYGRFDLSNYLMFGDKGKSDFDLLNAKEASPLPGTKLFEQSGYCLFHEDESTLNFDIGPLGMEPMAAHAHSDLLNFTLAVNGKPYIVDSGTYQYHKKESFWRNYFKGIRAHNTISIGGLDHAHSAGPFMWLKKPRSRVLDFQNSETKVSCKGTHTAFEKLSAQHSREISYEKGSRTYLITDTLNAVKTRVASYYLQFHPGLTEVRLLGSELRLAYGPEEFVVLDNHLFTKATLYHGDEQLPQGWYSDSYDKKEACYSLVLEFEFSGSMELETTIDFRNT